jgi:hypothetical protein
MKNKLTIPDNFIEPYLNIQELLKPVQAFREFTEQIKNTHTELIKNIAKVNESFKNLNRINAELFQDFSKHISYIGKLIKENCEKTPHSLLLLSRYGWYLDFSCDIWLPNELSKCLEDNESEKVDEYLINYYSKNLEFIFEELSNQHPTRRIILNEILSAHNQKMYFVTIPCILTQVDGICFDITAKKYFLKDKSNKWLPEIAAEFSNISNSVVEMYLSPIFSQNPINAHKSDLNNYPIQLNRHTIIHGVDLNYGNERNSLKCISLLKYVSDILSNSGIK